MALEDALKKSEALREFYLKFPSQYGLKYPDGEEKSDDEIGNEIVSKEDVLAFFNSPKELKFSKIRVRILPQEEKVGGYGYFLSSKEVKDVLDKWPGEYFHSWELMYALEITLAYLLEKNYGNVLKVHAHLPVSQVVLRESRRNRQRRDKEPLKKEVQNFKPENKKENREEKKAKNKIEEFLSQIESVLSELEEEDNSPSV